VIERIRGRKLQRIRQLWFMANPLCVACQAKGRVTPATELDHIQALDNSGKDEDSNRQGLCKDCHRAKTTIDMGYTVKHQIGVDGWPVGAG
jgi:5-methylcytosine-specific restriction protein A